MRSHFHQLHHQTAPLLLINIWDPASAVLAQQQGAKALGTSSAALAWSLGYADGQQLPVAELLAAVQRILRVIQLPFTVDIEQGYSDEPASVAKLVVQLAELGVSGINIEDGLSEPALLCDKIRACRKLLAGRELFINARTDVYLAGLAEDQVAVELCIERAALYQASGADGFFIPCLAELSAIQQLGKAIQLPINLMWQADLPNNIELASAGIKRLSYGPVLFLQCYRGLQNQIAFLLEPDVATSEPLTGIRMEQYYKNAALKSRIKTGSD